MGKSLSCRVRAEESEVAGDDSGGFGGVREGEWKVVMSRGRQTDKRSESHRWRKSERAIVGKLAKGSQGLSLSLFFSLPLCISFTWLAVSTNRIGSGARGLGRRIKTPNAFTALIPLPHNTPPSVLLFFSRRSLSPFFHRNTLFSLSPAILRRLPPHYK